MKRSAGPWAIGLGLAIAFTWSLAQETVLEVIPLRHRTVEEVLPVLRTLVEPEGAVSGMSGQLIVRAAPAKMAQIRQVLDSIDRPARRLLITVTQDVDQVRRERALSLSGSVRIGDSGRISVPPAPHPPSGHGLIVQGHGDGDIVRGQIRDRKLTESGRGTQQVQVLEGAQAFIEVGQSRPVARSDLVYTPHGPRVVTTHEYLGAGTGFYVRPRMSGDRVTLSIRSARDRFRGDRGGSIETQSIDTEVSASLGEWVEIGGVQQDEQRGSSEILGRRSEAGRDERRVYLKVEELR